jgi:hypothetical protein
MHEAYLRLEKQGAAEFQNREHFLAICAQLMRQILVDYARTRNAARTSMNESKFDSLEQYRTSPLFTDAERAALEYVTEPTKDKKVDSENFQRMARHYSERAICEIVWLVASEHFYNMTNIGMNIHSDMLCDISRRNGIAAS